MEKPKLSPWRNTAASDDVEIPWRVAESDGRPLLLVPGLGNSSRLFGTLPRSLIRLGWKPLIFDPPGLGRAISASREWSFDQALDDIGSVLDAAGFERATFLGSSMGGKLTLGFASRFGDRVERGILYGTECLGKVRARSIYAMFDVAFRMPSVEDTVRVLRPFLFGRSFQQAHSKIVDDMMSSYSPGATEKRTSLAQVRAMLELDFASFLPRVQAPILLHAGLEDSLVDPVDIRETASALANGTFIEVPKAGHSMLLENPKAALAALRIA